jgi:hypothetical protein
MPFTNVPHGSISSSSNREKPLSQAAALIVHMYDQDTTGQDFFDSVFANFESFDEVNGSQNNAAFENEVSIICQFTIASFTSPNNSSKVQDRIDSYFYIYRRIEEYENTVRQGFFRWSHYGKIKELKQIFHEHLGFIFASAKGTKPNLYINDTILLKKMNILEHLAHITTIDNIQTLRTFFALCKLLFQSSMNFGDDWHHPRWMDVVRKLRSSEVSLQQIIAEYVDCKKAFDEFPLDIPSFIHFITIKHPATNTQNSPFSVFNNLLRSLDLSYEMFYEQFRPNFDSNIKRKIYNSSHINILLQFLSSRHTLFRPYLSIYAFHANDDEIWNTFLYLWQKTDLNETVQKHLIECLTDRFPTRYVDSFCQYICSAVQHLAQIKLEYHSNYVKTLQAIIHIFIDKQCNEKHYSLMLTEQYLKQLFQLICSLPSAPDLQQPPGSLIIERLLFKNDRHVSVRTERLKVLFQRLNDFDENLYRTLAPNLIIRDDWLNDYVLLIPQEESFLSTKVYQDLCNNHQSNPWTIYVWSRITYRSLLNVAPDNTNNVLLNLNQWLVSVKQNVNNTLTIVFLVNLFDTIIIKFKKCILQLPNIEYTLDCIFHAREENNIRSNATQVNEFIDNGIECIEDILLLKGNFSSVEIENSVRLEEIFRTFEF